MNLFVSCGGLIGKSNLLHQLEMSNTNFYTHNSETWFQGNSVQFLDLKSVVYNQERFQIKSGLQWCKYSTNLDSRGKSTENLRECYVFANTVPITI